MRFGNDCEVGCGIEEVWKMRWGLSGKSLVLCMPLVLAKMNDVMNLSI